MRPQTEVVHGIPLAPDFCSTCSSPVPRECPQRPSKASGNPQQNSQGLRLLAKLKKQLDCALPVLTLGARADGRTVADQRGLPNSWVSVTLQLLSRRGTFGCGTNRFLGLCKTKNKGVQASGSFRDSGSSVTCNAMALRWPDAHAAVAGTRAAKLAAIAEPSPERCLGRGDAFWASFG